MWKLKLLLHKECVHAQASPFLEVLSQNSKSSVSFTVVVVVVLNTVFSDNVGQQKTGASFMLVIKRRHSPATSVDEKQNPISMFSFAYGSPSESVGQ